MWYACGRCGSVFVSVQALNGHMHVHTPNKLKGGPRDPKHRARVRMKDGDEYRRVPVRI